MFCEQLIKSARSIFFLKTEQILTLFQNSLKTSWVASVTFTYFELHSVTLLTVRNCRSFQGIYEKKNQRSSSYALELATVLFFNQAWNLLRMTLSHSLIHFKQRFVSHIFRFLFKLAAAHAIVSPRKPLTKYFRQVQNLSKLTSKLKRIQFHFDLDFCQVLYHDLWLETLWKHSPCYWQ